MDAKTAVSRAYLKDNYSAVRKAFRTGGWLAHRMGAKMAATMATSLAGQSASHLDAMTVESTACLKDRNSAAGRVASKAIGTAATNKHKGERMGW